MQNITFTSKKKWEIIKVWSMIMGISILLSGVIVFFLTVQPFAFEGEFDKSIILSETSKSENLKKHVQYLSENDRTTAIGKEKIINYLTGEIEKSEINLYGSSRKHDTYTGGVYYKFQDYTVNGENFRNIIVIFEPYNTKEGSPEYVIGAHYDGYDKLPGADDNASGVAGVLEILRIFSENRDFVQRRAYIELVFYDSEEPPYFATKNMGSYVHAEGVKNTNIDLAIILEMIGYYTDEEDSQRYPIGILSSIYPSKGNFIGIVSNFENSFATRKLKKSMNTYLSKKNIVPVSSMNAPSFITGVDFSDHRNYWKFDIPSVMITDTAFYRNRNYHTLGDTYEKLNYEKMSEVIDAIIYSLFAYNK